MGNVSGSKGKNKEFDQDEYYMECGHGHGQAHVNITSSYPTHVVHPHRSSQFPMTITPQIQRGEFNTTSTPYRSVNPEKSIPAVIGWIHGGTQVAIEGSWDNWRTRELLEGGSGTHFSIIKMLNSGVYHYHFLVDGQWTYAPDLPHERDEFANVYNILDLKVQDYYPENVERDQEPECPSSPISSYNNALFTLEDFSEKLPEMPPLLQYMPLNQPSTSNSCHQALQKPLSANLDHLYVKRMGSSQPVVALSSSQRFRSKFVTTVLYRPFKNKLWTQERMR